MADSGEEPTPTRAHIPVGQSPVGRATAMTDRETEAQGRGAAYPPIAGPGRLCALARPRKRQPHLMRELREGSGESALWGWGL